MNLLLKLYLMCTYTKQKIKIENPDFVFLFSCTYIFYLYNAVLYVKYNIVIEQVQGKVVEY